jgi:hypothetical protein
MPEFSTQQARRLVKRLRSAEADGNEAKAGKLDRDIAKAIIEGRWPHLPSLRSIQLRDEVHQRNLQ